jgi:phosphoglucosamine mutase
MGKLFGTDGVRGVANKELTPELAFRIGQAGACVLFKTLGHETKILIGKDTRISGDMLEAALAAGVCSVGGNVVLLGVIPTPAVAYLTRKYQADAGIMISASHNPMEYNGIKFFNDKGEKLSDLVEESIERLVLDESASIPVKCGDQIGRVTYNYDALEDYMQFAKSTISVDLKGLNIVVDCANGSSCICAPEVFRRLGANVTVLHNTPDGTNINLNCGSTHMESLRQYVKENQIDIGVAFDGDADRMLAVDENGELVDGDQVMAICALELKKQNKLPYNTLVATVMSNMGLFVMAEQNGINVVQTKVGDRYVLEEMLKSGYVLGGEQSGHVIFLEHNTTGDGLITALQLLSIVKKTGQPLSQLKQVMKVYPQVLYNSRIKNEHKASFLKDSEVSAEISRIERLLDKRGRILIRPSGTEPLVRVMLEGEDYALIDKEAKGLKEMLEKKFG